MSAQNNLCLTCIYLMAIDIYNNYYCALNGKITPRVACISFKSVELFKQVLEQLKPRESEQK